MPFPPLSAAMIFHSFSLNQLHESLITVVLFVISRMLRIARIALTFVHQQARFVKVKHTNFLMSLHIKQGHDSLGQNCRSIENIMGWAKPYLRVISQRLDEKLALSRRLGEGKPKNYCQRQKRKYVKTAED